MTDIIPQALTAEEIKKQEEREKRRIYQREYMRRRMKEDPEFRQKQTQASIQSHKKAYYQENSKFKEEKLAYNKQYYQKLKNAYKQVTENSKTPEE